MPWVQPIFNDFALSGNDLWTFLASYALGCFTAGYYLVRVLTRKDIRQIGSSSVGARNVGRVLGPIGFALVLFFDVTKGALAVAVTRYFAHDERSIVLAV